MTVPCPPANLPQTQVGGVWVPPDPLPKESHSLPQTFHKLKWVEFGFPQTLSPKNNQSLGSPRPSPFQKLAALAKTPT